MAVIRQILLWGLLFFFAAFPIPLVLVQLFWVLILNMFTWIKIFVLFFSY